MERRTYGLRVNKVSKIRHECIWACRKIHEDVSQRERDKDNVVLFKVILIKKFFAKIKFCNSIFVSIRERERENITSRTIPSSSVTRFGKILQVFDSIF